MHAIYQKNTIHRWVATPRLIREWLNHFYHKLEEISMVCKDGSIIFKSFIDDAVAREDLTDRPLQTEIVINPSEFELFNVICDVELTFNFRELKAILYFGEALGYPVKAFFERDGQPIIFTVNSSNLFEADFVLATLSYEDNMQQSQSQPASQLNSQRYNNNNNRSSQATQNSQAMHTPPSQIENKIKQEYDEYENSQGMKVLQDLGIDIDDVMMDNVFSTLLDSNLDMDEDDNMQTEMNLDSNVENNKRSNEEINNDNEQNKILNKKYNNEASTSTTVSTSSVVSASTSTNSITNVSKINELNNNNNNNNSEFKMPKPVRKIKQEIPNSNIIINSSVPPLHEIKKEKNKEINYGINQNQDHMNDSNNSDEDNEICPPSPEEDVATSIFSSQFDKQLSKKDKNNLDELDEIISSTPFKKPRMLFE